MTEEQPIYHLALRDLHATAGAISGIAHGWSLPFRYGDPAAEYTAIRQRAAVMDVSFRSRFLMSGTDALDVLKKVFAGHVEDVEEGRSLRTASLTHAGDIEDLVLISRTGGISYFISGDPERRAATFARLQDAVEPGWDVRLDDRTETTCLISLAGPGAAQAAQDHLEGALPARLQLLHCVMFEFHGFRTLAIRTSDLGEDGFEFMVAPAVAQHMIETLTGAGIPLAGFEAQEMARVESCIPSASYDAEGLTPAEADLDHLLGIPGGSSQRILAALLLESDHTIDAGTPILTEDGVAAGTLRSCVASHGLSSVIALGVVETARAMPGVSFQVAGNRALIAAKPFYRRR